MSGLILGSLRLDGWNWPELGQWNNDLSDSFFYVLFLKLKIKTGKLKLEWI